jgi:hypothetical protein
MRLTARKVLTRWGESVLNAAAETYIQRLNEQFPIPISYERIKLG